MPAVSSRPDMAPPSHVRELEKLQEQSLPLPWSDMLMRLGACTQAVSSRPDVAPPSYTRELEKLQDQIPPFPSADAMAVIEEDTGRPIHHCSHIYPQSP